MADAACTHCGTAITDTSTQVEVDKKRYCCRNCERLDSGHADQLASTGECGNCHEPIVEPSSMVQRGGQMYCCGNCATAGAGAAA
jgi:hypothetical protein